MKNPIRLNFFVFLCIVCAIETRAADPTPINHVLRDEDGDHVPDLLGKTVTVTGILTSEPLWVGRNAALANLQGEYAGIALFSRTPERLVGRFKEGEKVLATGKVSQFRGAEQLVVEEVQSVGKDRVPLPREVVANDLNGERYSGQLVRVVGTLVVPDEALKTRRGIHLKDRSGHVAVYLSDRFLDDVGFSHRLLKAGEAAITGIASQNKAESPFDSGYVLVPRKISDWEFKNPPPVKAMIVVGSMMLIAAFTAHLWLGRRKERRHNQQLLRMTDELKRVAEDLRDREARLQIMLSQVPAFLWTTDRDFLFTSCAGAGASGPPREASQLTGRSAIDSTAGADPGFSTAEAYVRALSGESISYPAEWNGRSYQCQIEALRNSGGAVIGVIGLALDVTEQCRFQAVLSQREEQLRESRKLEAIGQLAGGVAHDFNNLMTIILGYCSILKSSSPSNAASAVQEIERAANRAATLTKQLLAFGRKQKLKLEVVSVNRMVSEVLPLLRPVLDSNISVSTLLGNDAGFVHVDRAQFDQVIINFCLNARDAMPLGGTLAITTSKSEPYAGSSDIAPGSCYAVIKITDNGIGMDENTRSRIFEPFFTTKELGKGTGLGLSTAFGFIKQCSGHIVCNSKAGQGTEFIIYLPQAEAPAAREQQAPITDARETRLNANGRTVLLVEDESGVRSILSRTLADSGFQLLLATDGSAGLDLFASHRDSIDLLISDRMMPGLSGDELVRQARVAKPELPVLLISGIARDAPPPPAQYSFLQKPFTPRDLLHAISELLLPTGNLEPVAPQSRKAARSDVSR